MNDAVLRRFPARAHPLVLASDPDGLLADEAVRAELAARGYRLVEEGDPLRLWAAADALRPWTAERPVLIVTPRRLEELPYDLWEQGHRVVLSLAEAFPNLAYPVVRELTPAQRASLADAAQPGRRLGPRRTVEHILETVYGADLDALDDPGELLVWLNEVHAGAGPLPQAAREYLLERLGSVPGVAAWPLAELLESREGYRAFLRRAWADYVAHRARPRRVGEEGSEYGEVFEDAALQNGLGALVRSGNLQPVLSEAPDALPAWARVAVERDELGGRLARLDAALDAVSGGLSGEPGWAAWCAIARDWAEATLALYGGEELLEEATARYGATRDALDRRFVEWLGEGYTPLGARRLPEPHHVHHVPHYLAYCRGRAGAPDRVALLVLDGLALSDWCLVRRAWHERHPDWAMEERLLLAQVPTTTAVSRQALVSGLRPEQFADTLGTNAAEEALWMAFWTSQGLDESGVAYVRLALDRAPVPDALLSNRLVAACLVDHSVDELTHGASLGTVQVQDSVRRWLGEYSPMLEGVIDDLVGRGFAVYLASDHGHVEATGVGRPNEGILAEARGQRCRVYADRRVAERVAQTFPSSIIWEDDGLLPNGLFVVMPAGRQAYTTHGDVVVTHGGLTLEEMVVPFVAIARR